MKDIQENNRLIAQFMGFTIEKNIGYYDNEMLMGQNVYDQQNGNCFDELLFNTSWDWLMPVVEKIESLGFPVTIYIEGVYIESAETGKDICRMNLETCHETSKIDRTYKAVVEFIAWYNENKKD